MSSRLTFGVILCWLVIQGVLGWSGFYKMTDGLPPRFMFLIVPPLIVVCCLFFTNKGRQFIDGLDVKALTLMHIIRIPVELVLYWLFVHGSIPQLMTFEGRNWDILSGLTAPVIYYFGFIKNKLSRGFILVWNIICLGLLINIMANAILSVPSPLQKFAFDQPNIAVMYFPFNWLPSVIVPLVLFAHLVSIRRFQKKVVV